MAERSQAIRANRAVNDSEVRAGAVRLASTPLHVNIELTGCCNIDPPCVFCSGKNFGHNYAPLDLRYLDKYAEFLERCEHVNEDSFGEPLSHHALLELAERITAAGQRFSLVTNGLMLTSARADRLAACGPRLGLHVSFNAAREETYFKLTGRSFAHLVANVRYYVDSYRRRNAGLSPDLILTFIVMKVNRHEVPDFVGLAHELGARALLASLHDRPGVPLGHFGYDFVYVDEMLPYGELVSIGRAATARAQQLGVSCMLQWDATRDSAIRGFAEPGVSTPCLVPWRFIFIQEHTQTVFGCPYHVVPCGDLTRATLAEIWNGDNARGLRHALARGEIPKYCRDHSAACPLVMAAEQRGRERRIEARVIVGDNDYDHFVAGWHRLEHVPEAVRWTSAAAEFLLCTEGRKRLYVEATTWGPEPVRGWVEVESRRLGRFRVTRDRWHTLAFRLPRAGIGAAVRGRITTNDVWVPAEAGLGLDIRQLGIAVRRIWAE